MGEAETAALREALEAILNLPTVVPDHSHGGVRPPYLEWQPVAAIARAALTATEAVREPALRAHEGRDAEVAGLDAVQSAFEIAFRRPDATAAEGRALEIALTLFAQARALASTDKPDPAS